MPNLLEKHVIELKAYGTPGALEAWRVRKSA
jgi:hypothetical protein